MRPLVSKPLLGKNFGKGITRRFQGRLRTGMIIATETTENPNDPTEIQIDSEVRQPFDGFIERMETRSSNPLDVEYDIVQLHFLTRDYIAEVNDRIDLDDEEFEITSILYGAPDDSYFRYGVR